MRSSYTQKPEGLTIDEDDLSLEELLAGDAERLKLTPDKLRSVMNARHARVRAKLLADHGLTEETIEGAPEDVRVELGSKLRDECYHSPDATLEHGLLKAAVAREKRLLVKAKAEAILAVQRKRASDFSVPK